MSGNPVVLELYAQMAAYVPAPVVAALSNCSQSAMRDQGEESMTVQNEVRCFVAGLAAGTAVAMLFVPKSGPQMRTYLKQTAAAGAAYLKHQSSDLATTTTGLVQRGSKRVRHEQENVAEAMGAAREAYRAAEEATPGIAG
jgi:gas vesicle protein